MKILNEDILRLVFAFVPFVHSAATSGYVAVYFSTSGSVAGSFIGNNLLLKLLRTFSFALNNNPKL